MNCGLRTTLLSHSLSLSLLLSYHFLLLYSPSLSLSLQSHLTNQSTNHHPYLGRYLVGDFPLQTLLVVIIRGAAFSSQYAPKNSRLSWTSLRHRGRTAPYRVLGMFGKLGEPLGMQNLCLAGYSHFLFHSLSL